MRKLVLLLVGGGLVAILAAIMVLVMTDTSPAQADTAKTLICHYNDGLNPNGKQVHASFWSVDNVADKSLPSHLGHSHLVIHAHHATTDGIITGGLTVAVCEGRTGHPKLTAPH